MNNKNVGITLEDLKNMEVQLPEIPKTPMIDMSNYEGLCLLNGEEIGDSCFDDCSDCELYKEYKNRKE